MTATPALTAAHAARFAELALANVAQEYPHKLDQVLDGDGDLRPPRALHPSFHGSYDWHSCVHMHWLLAVLRRRFPGLPHARAIEATFDRHFAPEAIAGECAFLDRGHTRSFERTYGWAWLLALAHELDEVHDPAGQRWSAGLAPLARRFVDRYLDYLPRALYPIRHGTHPNSAFGLAFALDYARRAGLAALEAACIQRALLWFGDDRDAPGHWEPSGADFLSPVLMEAQLMRRVLDPGEYDAWLGGFLPGLASRAPTSLFTPATVSDRSDPQIVHLDGLNLSRAWCWRGIAGALPSDDPRAAIALEAAAAHARAGMAGVESDDYMGSHWLASFAALALVA